MRRHGELRGAILPILDAVRGRPAQTNPIAGRRFPIEAQRALCQEMAALVGYDFLRGRLDRTEASLAVDDLQAWPAERFSHRFLLGRAWELRETVRGWDAMYVALAELMDAPLLTADQRLANTTGPRCRIEGFG